MTHQRAPKDCQLSLLHHLEWRRQHDDMMTRISSRFSSLNKFNNVIYLCFLSGLVPKGPFHSLLDVLKTFTDPSQAGDEISHSSHVLWWGGVVTVDCVLTCLAGVS